jgi:cysteine-rich repeat protein
LACTVCNSSCQSVPGETDFCTDGVLDPVEFCDDGDTNNANGCSNTCGCSTGFHQEGGVCASDVRSCSIANGTGTETWNGSAYGLCTLSSCNSGYHANGNACDADVISCSPMPLNTTTGTQTWNGSAYGSCVATACSSGFHVESGVCTSDTRSCSITNGTGTQTWNGSAWGTCIVTACDTGFWPWENTCQAGGNVLVSRVGDGVATLVSTGNAVSLQEYLPTGGTVVSTTTMPTVVGTPNNRLINSGTAGSQGFFGARGAVVALAGYDAPIPTTSLVSATGVNRVGNIFDGNLSVASSTRYTFGNSTVLAGSNLRSIVPLTATTGYIGANNSGVTYYNGASVTSISAGNFRNVEIYNGVLYYSTGSGSAGIYRYATAAPTTTSTPTALFTTSASPYGFVIFDTNVDGTPDTAYVCDDGSAGNGGGLRKYRWDGAAWTNPWRVRVNAAPSTALADTNTEACAGLTGYQANGAVTLFFVTSTTSNNRVLSVTDTASSATAPSTSTLVATAGTNLWFRGVDIKGF